MTNSANKMTPREQAREMAKECVAHYYENSMGFTMEDAIADKILPLCLLNSAVEKLEEKIKANKNSYGRTFFNETVDDHANNIRHKNQMCIAFTLGGQSIFENFEHGSTLSSALIKLSEKLNG